MSEEVENIQFLKNMVKEHSQSTIWERDQKWISGPYTIRALDTLNQQNQEIKSLESDIAKWQNELDTITVIPSSQWNEQQKKRAEELYNDIKNSTIQLEKTREDFNKSYQDGQKYLKGLKQVDGKIVSNFTYTDQNGKRIDMTLSGSTDPQLENYDIEDAKYLQPDMKFMYKDEDAETINQIINKFERGETIDNIEFEKLLSMNSSNDVDAFNTLNNGFFNINFKYNIKRDINEQLIDIRNIKNFRASNITSNDVKLTKSTQGNFINPTTADGTNASKSFYMSKNDFYWSQNYNDLIDENKMREAYSIQNIILNQYQPSLQYNMGLQVAEQIDAIAGGTVDVVANKALGALHLDSFAGFFDSMAHHAIEKIYNDRMETMGKHPERLYAEERYEDFTNPMYYIEHLFNNGKWLNTYELPFISAGKVKTEYLDNGSQPGSWDIGGLTDNFSENGAMQKILTDRISLSLPTSPTFNLGSPHLHTMSPFNIDFYLINKDDFYLAKNFQLMQALFAGTQWLSMEMGVTVATNVYHVLVPGRFQIHWAYMTSNFQAMGKLRTNKYMYEMYGGSNGSVERIGMIDNDTLWPEAWHVTLNIHPLTPWNFNTHMAYYLNGFGANQRNRLATAKTAWWNTGVTLQNTKNQIRDVENRKNALGQQLNKYSSEVMEALEQLDRLEQIYKQDGWWSKDNYEDYLAAKERLDKNRAAFDAAYQEAKEVDQLMMELDEQLGVDHQTSKSQSLTQKYNIEGMDRTIASRSSQWTDRKIVKDTHWFSDDDVYNVSTGTKEYQYAGKTPEQIMAMEQKKAVQAATDPNRSGYAQQDRQYLLKTGKISQQQFETLNSKAAQTAADAHFDKQRDYLDEQLKNTSDRDQRAKILKQKEDVERNRQKNTEARQAELQSKLKTIEASKAQSTSQQNQEFAAKEAAHEAETKQKQQMREGNTAWTNTANNNASYTEAQNNSKMVERTQQYYQQQQYKKNNPNDYRPGMGSSPLESKSSTTPSTTPSQTTTSSQSQDRAKAMENVKAQLRAAGMTASGTTTYERTEYNKNKKGDETLETSKTTRTSSFR